MPLAYLVDHGRRRARQTGTDPIGTTDVIAVQDRQVADGAWSYGTLVDFTRVTWVPTSGEIRQFLAHVHALSADHGPRGPLAMVALPNSALFGMFRMYSILGEEAGARIVAFSSIEQAEGWLNQGAPHG
jgi:hypothetical protein